MYPLSRSRSFLRGTSDDEFGCPILRAGSAAWFGLRNIALSCSLARGRTVPTGGGGSLRVTVLPTPSEPPSRITMPQLMKGVKTGTPARPPGRWFTGKRRVGKVLLSLLTLGSALLGGREVFRENLKQFGSDEQIATAHRLLEASSPPSDWLSWCRLDDGLGEKTSQRKNKTDTRSALRQREHQRAPELHVATANVLTARAASRRLELANDFDSLSLDVVGGQEGRMDGPAKYQVDNWRVFAPATAVPGHLGAHIWVHKRWWRAVTSVGPISERIMVVRLKARNMDVTFISAHAPHEDAPEKEREAFFKLLEWTMRRVKKRSALVLLADLNAQLGSVVTEGVGAAGAAKENRNGTAVREIIDSFKLRLVNTFVAASPTHFRTNGRAVRLDYIAVPRRLTYALRKARVLKRTTLIVGAGREDHRMVSAYIAVAPKRAPPPTSQEIHLELRSNREP